MVFGHVARLDVDRPQYEFHDYDSLSTGLRGQFNNADWDGLGGQVNSTLIKICCAGLCGGLKQAGFQVCGLEAQDAKVGA